MRNLILILLSLAVMCMAGNFQSKNSQYVKQGKVTAYGTRVDTVFVNRPSPPSYKYDRIYVRKPTFGYSTQTEHNQAVRVYYNCESAGYRCPAKRK